MSIQQKAVLKHEHKPIFASQRLLYVTMTLYFDQGDLYLVEQSGSNQIITFKTKQLKRMIRITAVKVPLSV